MNYTCPECSGKGTYEILYGPDVEGRYRFESRTCGTCHGAGYIWKPEPNE